MHVPDLTPSFEAQDDSRLPVELDGGVARSRTEDNGKHPFLVRLGDRVRNRRNGRGMTRKELAAVAGVSERHLGNLELGVGNASVLILLQVASALKCSPADFLRDEDRSAEWSLIRELLENQDEATLRRVREAILPIVDAAGTNAGPRPPRIALIGLRGAGKSTLGRMLADDLGVPFVELDEKIESLTGMDTGQIHGMLGQGAYRRYELQALESAVDSAPSDTVNGYGGVVIAAPGSIVSEPETYGYLLANCCTVWVKASPEEHMARVIAQGDLRPMTGNREAMHDLRRILANREPLYAQADIVVDSAGRTVADTYEELRRSLKPE
jgi:XRE family aerobic/anaerobic benzoate catabolism transcriptional regulator